MSKGRDCGMNGNIFNYHGYIKETDPVTLARESVLILSSSGFTIFDAVEYSFQPIGWTGLWLLGESHFAIHTFPEINTTYFELSSCNEEMCDKFILSFCKGYPEAGTYKTICMQ